MYATRLVSAALLLGVTTLSSGVCSAASRMLGVTPADGVAMFAKRFSVEAGATIVGTHFESNDPRTVFPEVKLVRGGADALTEGMVVESATDVSGDKNGSVLITWSSAVHVSQSDNYFVAVRLPKGSSKRGSGDGPAVGAEPVTVPGGSFLSTGADEVLMPLGVDLAMTLVCASPAKATARAVSKEAPRFKTFLNGGNPNPFNPTTKIEFGVAQAAPVHLGIYDVRGSEVRSFGCETLAAGDYTRIWDGKDDRGRRVGAGIYVVRLTVGVKTLQGKVALVK